MSKYYYLALSLVGGLLIIALIILSQIDKIILNSSKTLSDNTKTKKQSYHLFSSKAQDDNSSPIPSPVKKPSKDKKTHSPTLLNLRLVGTTVWGEKSSVIIEDLAKGGQGFYRLGDTIKGFKITKISQDSATLTKKDQQLVLKLVKGSIFPQSGEFARKIGKDTWALSADKISEMVNNLNQYLGQVIAFQHRENGKPSGFRIRHLKQENDFEKIGIENGDIIKKVNDLEINDLSDVVKAVYQLSNETTFQLEVERNSQKKTLTYQLDKSVSPLVPIISNMFKMPLAKKGSRRP